MHFSSSFIHFISPYYVPYFRRWLAQYRTFSYITVSSCHPRWRKRSRWAEGGMVVGDNIKLWEKTEQSRSIKGKWPHIDPVLLFHVAIDNNSNNDHSLLPNQLKLPGHLYSPTPAIDRWFSDNWRRSQIRDMGAGQVNMIPLAYLPIDFHHHGLHFSHISQSKQ